MPAVSVIMIFLNAERFLDEAVQSLLWQTTADWELILVDDGSTDRSTDLARAYSARMPGKLIYVDHPGHANLGMSAARNAGLRVARGAFIAFLDADDVFLPTRLQRHLEILREHPEVGMVQSCLEYWHSWQGSAARENDSRDRPPPIAFDSPVLPPTLLALMLQTDGATVPGVCSVTIRRPALQAVGGFEDAFRSTYEDQVMLAKIYLRQRVYIIDETLARYRQHAASSLHRAGVSSDYTPGRPHDARFGYLQWLGQYLREQQVTDALVWESLTEAIWPYRHPLRWRLRSLPQEALRLGRIWAPRLLPASVTAALVHWRGKQKLAAAERMTRRRGAQISRRVAVDAATAAKGDTDGSPREGRPL